jgi:Domain of unknown function (DUF4157)
MRTLATKQPTHDSAKEKKNGDKGRSRSISPLSTGMPLLQRQCACGGGCPRCQDELGIQTKLKISEPGDKYEQEADRIADEVMRMPEPSQRETQPRSSLGISSSLIVQRQVEAETEQDNLSRPSPLCGQEGDRCLDRGCSQFGKVCEPIEPGTMRGCRCVPTSVPASQASILQRHASNRDEPDTAPSIVHEVLNSSGEPLDLATRTLMESRFGHDFSQVQIHTDTKAAESAKAVNALAYTVGQDVVFGTGQYVPATSMGQKLIAHELAHVLQQTSGSQTNLSVSLSTPVADSTNLIQRRILGMAGSCWFENCENQLHNFFMIPEDGPPGFNPSGGSSFRVDDIDGLWFKFHTPKDEWFKIPDIGTGQVTCDNEDEEHPNIRSPILAFATADWTNEGIHTPNPF